MSPAGAESGSAAGLDQLNELEAWIRNENSAAAGREVVPASIAANNVAAERDVPGNTAARICAMPTQLATKLQADTADS